MEHRKGKIRMTKIKLTMDLGPKTGVDRLPPISRKMIDSVSDLIVNLGEKVFKQMRPNTDFNNMNEMEKLEWDKTVSTLLSEYLQR